MTVSTIKARAYPGYSPTQYSTSPIKEPMHNKPSPHECSLQNSSTITLNQPTHASLLSLLRRQRQVQTGERRFQTVRAFVPSRRVISSTQRPSLNTCTVHTVLHCTPRNMMLRLLLPSHVNVLSDSSSPAPTRQPPHDVGVSPSYQ